MTYEEQPAVYEILLQGPPPPSLVARFPAITVHTAPATTILSRRISDPTELDLLIERLRSLGITPLEVRKCSGNYEFRIAGRFGNLILRYLQWTARLDPEHTVIHLSATPTELRMILDELAGSGIAIDHFIHRPAA